MKIALVHDYFTQLGGAERVAEALYQMLPNPTVFATVSNRAKLPRGLLSADLRTSWMQHLPMVDRYYRHYFPLYPMGVANLNLTGYDLVVSSSSGYAKGVKTDPGALHICYCHNPMRWVWRYSDYASRENFSLAKRLLVPPVINRLRRWDENAALQPDQFVVNSHVVAKRVWTAYRRPSIVIPPPINTDRFQIAAAQEDYYLVLTRLVSYKRVDLAIEACNRLNRRLIIVGDGPDRQRLQNLSGPTIEFVGRLTDEAVNYYAGKCRALLLPGEEDFGMVPLEINAAGRPAIAFKAGGALETIREGVSGLFFERPTSESLIEAIIELESRTWHPDILRKHAESYNTQAFRLKFSTLLNRLCPGLSLASPELLATAVVA